MRKCGVYCRAVKCVYGVVWCGVEVIFLFLLPLVRFRQLSRPRRCVVCVWRGWNSEVIGGDGWRMAEGEWWGGGWRMVRVENK